MNTKHIMTAVLMSISVATFAQEPTAPVPPVAPEEPSTSESPVEVKKSKSEDTTRIKIGSSTIIIIEDENGGQKVIDTKDVEGKDHKLVLNDDDEFGHWAGFSLGVNGLLTYDNKLEMGPNAQFLELDYARSVTANLNLVEKRMPIIKRHLAFTTGIGFQWNRYGIKNNYDITYNNDSIYGVMNTTRTYDKNVLKATYIQVPLLLEVSLGKNADESFHIGAGVLGGYKLGSRLKQRWEENGDDHKSKIRGSYHFNPFQAYLVAEIGYGGFTLFMNYGLSRVFTKGEGPQLYPVTVGLRFLDF